MILLLKRTVMPVLKAESEVTDRLVSESETRFGPVVLIIEWKKMCAYDAVYWRVIYVDGNW